MKPFLSGKKEHSQPALSRPQSGPARPLAATVRPAAGEDDHGPNIEVVKQGDKVIRLIVTCSCGERMEVECLYPAGS
jgi:hypothetical protein